MNRRRATRLGLRLITIIGIPVIAMHVALRWCPYPDSLLDRPPSAIWMVDRHHVPLATLIASDGSLQRWINADELGPYLANAVVAVEDQRFLNHGAVDWRSLVGTLLGDIHALSLHRGASTITMQLARLRETMPHSIAGKLMQAFRATQMEQRESKQRILLDYLNRAPFGGDLVGVAAASWRYFGKPPASLSLSQAAMLAGLPQSPNGNRPDRHPERAKARRDHVLNRMLVCGSIDATQYRHAVEEPINARWLSLPQMDSPDALQPLAHGAMPTLLDIANHQSGGECRLTLDAATQASAFGITQPALDAFNANGSHAAAAVVVLDVASSECLAAISLGDRMGLDLTHRRRSTGSVLKPFIYAAAFQDNLASPRSVLNDASTAWIGYEPRNFDRSFRGQIDADAALAESRNLPAMTLLARVGVGDMSRLLQSVGIDGLAANRSIGLTLAVGGAEASAWEVAQAYAMLARGGSAREATLIARSASASTTLLTQPACMAVVHALNDDQRTRAICPAAALLGAAWKTGTSSGSRDAWCAAITPRQVVVVWIGSSTGAGDSAIKGAAIAAPIALNILATIDPGGPAFAESSTPPAQTPLAATHQHALAIAAPLDQQAFVIDPEIVLDQQRIMFRAVSDDRSTSRLWWFIDRTLVGQTSTSDSIAWVPTMGKHLLRVVGDEGKSAIVRFTVLSQ